jgi:hypothetical protein
MTHKVFLSYARGDRALAKVLGERMRALGADVFDDETILLPGANWQEVLRDALEAADVVVYLAPNPGTSESNFAFFEVGAARALGKRIIPILPTQDAMRIRELPAGIQDLQALDGSRLAPDALAESIVATLDAA